MKQEKQAAGMAAALRFWRRAVLLLGPVLLAAGLSAGALIVWAGAETWDHTVSLPFLAHNRAVTRPSFGIQIYNSDPDIMNTVTGAGAQWIHLPFRWDWVEPITDVTEYEWPAWYDDQLREYAAHHVRVILTFGSNPDWAATYPNGPIDKAPIGVLAEFMTAAVQHYSAPDLKVGYWEFYNEPDNTFEGCAPEGQCGWWGSFPDEYADLLKAVYPAIKSVRPEVQVVLGGLAYDRWDSEGCPDHCGPFAELFLDNVLASGGGPYFDVMNFHYYPVYAPKWDPYGMGLIGKATYIRNKLAGFGLYKPVICTETSMWSDPLHGGSEVLQRRYVPQAFARALAANLDVTVWFLLADTADQYAWKYGLVGPPPSLTPKPAYTAYQVMAQQLADATYLGTWATDPLGVEAYQFMTRDGSTRVVVTWANGEGIFDLAVTADQVEVLDLMGGSSILYDDDGDGQVHVPMGLDAVYLRY